MKSVRDVGNRLRISTLGSKVTQKCFQGVLGIFGQNIEYAKKALSFKKILILV
jgi:hypothetical protein